MKDGADDGLPTTDGYLPGKPHGPPVPGGPGPGPINGSDPWFCTTYLNSNAPPAPFVSGRVSIGAGFSGSNRLDSDWQNPCVRKAFRKSGGML